MSIHNPRVPSARKATRTLVDAVAHIQVLEDYLANLQGIWLAMNSLWFFRLNRRVGLFASAGRVRIAIGPRRWGAVTAPVQTSTSPTENHAA